MRKIQPGTMPTSRVTALFDDGVFFFPLPFHATLEDLAGQLAALGAGSRSRTIAVNLTFNVPA